MKHQQRKENTHIDQHANPALIRHLVKFSIPEQNKNQRRKYRCDDDHGTPPGLTCEQAYAPRDKPHSSQHQSDACHALRAFIADKPGECP